MLLVIDVGNTNTAIGIFDGERLISDWRLATDRYRTADEWGQLVSNLLHLENMENRSVTGVSVSCVVPPLESVLERMCNRYFGIQPFFVNQETAGMPILYENPSEVGADRIVNAVAADEKYGVPCIVIDFGTATTFDVISRRTEYVGGVICPGIRISANALFEKAARLPRIDMVKPAKIIGSNTVGSMQSGLYYGYLELVRGLINRIRGELREDAKVIITGGNARMFAEELGADVIHDSTLTLEGLRLIYQRNRG